MVYTGGPQRNFTLWWLSYQQFYCNNFINTVNCTTEHGNTSSFYFDRWQVLSKICDVCSQNLGHCDEHFYSYSWLWSLLFSSTILLIRYFGLFCASCLLKHFGAKLSRKMTKEFALPTGWCIRQWIHLVLWVTHISNLSWNQISLPNLQSSQMPFASFSSFCLSASLMSLSISFYLRVSLWLCLYLPLSWKTTRTLWSNLRCSSLVTCQPVLSFSHNASLFGVCPPLRL